MGIPGKMFKRCTSSWAPTGNTRWSSSIIKELKPGDAVVRLIPTCVAIGMCMVLAGSSMAAESTNTPLTFAKDVAPILQEKCQNCHRAGQMAPMSLVTYEETRPWAKSIRERVLTRQMPPWHLDKTVGIQHFQNDLSLTDTQISTIAQWVEQGAAPGDPKDMPPPKQWPKENGWQLSKQFGEPDLILRSE